MQTLFVGRRIRETAAEGSPGISRENLPRGPSHFRLGHAPGLWRGRIMEPFVPIALQIE